MTLPSLTPAAARCQASDARIARIRLAGKLGFADRYAVQGIALLNRVYGILALGDLSEHGMFSVQPIGYDVGDKKLAAVRIRTRICHRKRSHLVLVGIPLDL